MKNLIIIFLMLISVGLYSQESIYFKGGLGLTSFVSKMKDVKGSQIAGFELEVQTREHLAATLSAQYQSGGMKYLITKKNDLKETAHYINTYLGARYIVNNRLFVSGGTYIGFHIKSSIEKMNNDFEDSYFDNYPDYTNDDFGLFLNLGVSNPSRSVYGYTQFESGIINVKGIQNGIMSKRQTVSISIAFRL